MQNRRVFWVVGAAVLLAVLAAVYFFFDPAEAAWMPKCVWKAATGTDCPGCGSQRMMHALMHGDFSAAWHANAFALCILPLIGFMVWLELSRHRHPVMYGRIHAPWVVGSLLAALLAWWIVRNLV